MSNQGNGRQSGTMGESTRQRLAGLIQGAKSGNGAEAGGAAGDRPRTPGAAYVGGFQGSLAGTWGKAVTGRSGPGTADRAHNPLLGGQAPRPSAALVAERQKEIEAAFHPKPGRVKPASTGAKNIWDVLPPKGSAAILNRRAQQHAATRPQSAGPRLQQQGRPSSRQPATQDDYKVRGSRIGGLASNTAAAAAAAAGAGGAFDSGSSFDALPGAGSASAASFSFAGPAAGTAAGAGARQAGHEVAGTASSFNRLGLSPSSGASSPVASDLTEARMARLDDAIRDALRTKRSVYEDSKAMLLRLFKEVDDGSGDVDVDEFCEVCGKLGVAVSQAEAAGLFRRAGYDNAVMPYQKWAHNLISQPSRQLAAESAVRKGAFLPGQSANFNGKIIYEECRKPVWTPSAWDPKLAERSAELPDARLNLEFAYGYAGAQTTGQNLFYNCKGQAVYMLAGVGVVYTKPPQHCQHFFLGHSDDIKSLAVSPAAVKVEDQEYPAGSLVATGQVSSHADGPVICVWDSRVGYSPALNLSSSGQTASAELQLAKLQLDKEMRGIVALGFSPNGSLLAGVATDNSHTVSVWDWRAGWRLMGEGKGCMGEPPQVFGLEWNPHELNHHIDPQFVTFGKKHIKIWKPAAPGGTWTATQLSFGKLPLQNVVSAAFLTPRGPQNECLLVAGMADGQAYLFKGITPVSAIAAHKPGPKSIQPDGQPAFEGLRGMRLCRQSKTLLIGGADGVIMQWDVSDGNMAEGKFAAPSITLKHPYGSDKPPIVRSLDYQDTISGGGTILVGTLDSCIWEVDSTSNQQQILVPGHSHDVWAVAFHPSNPHIAASVCDGNRVWVWDLKARQLLRSASVGFVCRAVVFSSVAYGATAAAGGYHIAVGGAKGHIRVVTESELRPVWEGRDSTQGISEMDFSPDGKLLAVATFDAWIDVYNVEKGYQRIARCSGHSATVRTIDWSSDSSVLQSNCAAREILYWNARSGKQMPNSCRDVDWSSWTCIYGFPVMGIWPDTADGSDINSCDRSKSGRYLATCDDYGLVKLFNYPVVIEDAPHRAYRGHSSHVMCVRFNSDDSLVCSTGGKDWAMFQFRLTPVDPEEAAAGAASTGAEAAGGAGAAAAAAAGGGAGRKGLLAGGGAGGKKESGKPDMVWGPLDASGRTFGWVPAGSPTGAAAATAAAAGPAVTAAAGAASGQQPWQQQQQRPQTAPLTQNSAAAGQQPVSPTAANRQQHQQAAAAVSLGPQGQQQLQQLGITRYGAATEVEEEIGEEAVVEDDADSVDDEF